MSKSEFKTERRINTASKFGSERRVKTGVEYSLSGSEEESFLDNIDSISIEDLKTVKKLYKVKTKAKSKSGLKKVIKTHLTEEDKGTS